MCSLALLCAFNLPATLSLSLGARAHDVTDRYDDGSCATSGKFAENSSDSSRKVNQRWEN